MIAAAAANRILIDVWNVSVLRSNFAMPLKLHSEPDVLIAIKRQFGRLRHHCQDSFQPTLVANGRGDPL